MQNQPWPTQRPPSGCRLCGVAEHQHGNWWTSIEQRRHTYEAPSQEQIKARMLARRRDQAPQEG